MNELEHTLARWKSSLLSSIPVGGLRSRNPAAYKWKAPFRCMLIREAAFWRATYLLSQCYELHKNGHGLGARILLRSGFETLASLLYLNHNMRLVLDGSLDFHEFGKITVRQAVGSKNEENRPAAVNVITMLDKGDQRYPGLRTTYDSLSESAHPNFEGMVWGFSKVDHDEFQTNFSDRWMELYGDRNEASLRLCMETFELEYDQVWHELMEALERWIEANDKVLEASKPK